TRSVPRRFASRQQAPKPQDLSMSRQDANAAFARTSFLYGGNADYIENLYARYETDPTAVDPEWRALFGGVKKTRAQQITSIVGPASPAPLCATARPSP